MTSPLVETLDTLEQAGLRRASPLAVGVVPRLGVGLVTDGAAFTVAADDDTIAALLGAIEEQFGPRWVLWSRIDSAAILALGVQIASCWDIAAVYRLTVGGWRAEPGRVWARHAGLDDGGVPDPQRGDGSVVDLFTAAEQATGDPDRAIRDDGYLRPDWGRTGWWPALGQLETWTATAFEVATAQMAERAEFTDRPAATLVARSESAAELLCNELTAGGLPMDLAIATAILTELVGPRPGDEREADEQRRARDELVLRHVPTAADLDLRSPGQVKTLLRRVGIEVEDTRAWRLEPLIDSHPVIGPLLAWRKAERIATTFGYSWLDEHVGADGRLRGSWTGSDGAAGRMTASAGLHNMTADLRPAVVAEPGHVFIRSDLGQIEPRVLAAVSRDALLAKASATDDLYAGVAETLNVERDIAKVAVLGAMYGQTTGRGAQALVELRRAYPVSMGHLDDAEHEARAGHDVWTYGGRRVQMDNRADFDLPENAARSRAAARGRYGRNAIIQGAAAELFKMWAVTVRARTRGLGSEIVLCLHDELVVHAPREVADEVAAAVDAALQEAVGRWAPGSAVRFVTDTSVVSRWSDAKA